MLTDCVYMCRWKRGGEQGQRPSSVLHHRVAQISGFCSHFPAESSTAPHVQGYAILCGGYSREDGTEEEATWVLKTAGGGAFGWRTQEFSRGWECEGLQAMHVSMATQTPQKRANTGPSQIEPQKAMILGTLCWLGRYQKGQQNAPGEFVWKKGSFISFGAET